MRDPRRIVDDPSVHALERRLVESGLHAGPTDAGVEALWGALATRLPAGADPGASASQAPPRTSAVSGPFASLGVGKLIAAVGLSAMTALAGDPSGPADAGARSEVPSTKVSVVPPVVPVAVPATPAEEAPPPTVAVQATDSTPRRLAVNPIRAPSRSAPAEARAKVPPPAAPDDEVRVVLAARSALREGDCGAALRLLEDARTSGGARLLAEERDVLAVEALACSGRTDEARSRAVAFLAAHPRSMHAGTMQRIAGGSSGEE
ncbi:MAG TPA: hypothetical protein VK762_10565 [Polyangiaceae bacterium]|nr:hypothetical protein [Polyangiaceae bacterium]